MKHFYLLLIFFGINLISGQVCPDKGFASGNLVYFINYVRTQCTTDLLTYETSDTPIPDNAAFTADFGGTIGTCDFEADGTLPIEEFILNKVFQVYPNPLRYGNDITLSFGSPTNAEISLYNVTGRKALELTIEDSASKNIDLSSLSNGVYMLKIAKGDAMVTRKIVIMK